MITTERTVLRNFNKDDLKDLNEYCSQEGVGEMAGWKHHESMFESKSILKMFMKSREQYAIVYKENNKVIGHIGIHKDSEEGRADTKELGYVLNKNYWGKGIMTEVVQAVLEYLFKGNVVDNVYACCFTNNTGSKRVIEKCGFKFECNDKYVSRTLNTTFDSYDYIITREMWNNSRKKS